jgi:hypothetical protein
MPDICPQRRAARVFQFIPSLLLDANCSCGKEIDVRMYTRSISSSVPFPTASAQFLNVKSSLVSITGLSEKFVLGFSSACFSLSCDSILSTWSQNMLCQASNSSGIIQYSSRYLLRCHTFHRLPAQLGLYAQLFFRFLRLTAPDGGGGGRKPPHRVPRDGL